MRAYNQMPVASEDVCKTVLTTPFGIFEFMFIPFGLHNATQTFQRFIDEVLRGLDFVYGYTDNIIVTSESKEEHVEYLKILFPRFKSYGITVNPGKCVFSKPQVQFLGYLVSGRSRKPIDSKGRAIVNYPRPVTAKQLKQFLGIMNFYRRFLPGAAQVQAWMNDLLRDNLRGRAPVTGTP